VRLVRCERHGLAYDPDRGTGCVLCRSESRRPSAFPPLDRVLVGLLAAIVVMLVGGVFIQLATPAFERWLGPTGVPSASVPAPTPGRAAPERPRSLQIGTFTLQTKNASGRAGAFFIPPEAAHGPRPLLVLFHGTGGSGAQILATFSTHAARRGLIVLAPDSGRSPDGAYNWQVPDTPGDEPPDVLHARACLGELYATAGLRIDPARVLAAGHSGGGSSAAYLGTTDPRVQAFAVLHGGVFAGGLGSSRSRAWFSTGSDDALRPPAVIERAAEATRPHAGEVTTHLYPGGHALSQAELDDLMAWWLDR
jgi:poly(3-hydroxybutyrate) depolymerase